MLKSEHGELPQACGKTPCNFHPNTWEIAPQLDNNPHAFSASNNERYNQSKIMKGLSKK